MMNNLMRNLFLIFMLLCTTVVSAQSLSDAEALFNQGEYAKSYDIYEKLLKNRNATGLLRYKAARCLLPLNRYEEAILLLNEAAKRKVTKAYYYLYIAYFESYYFEKAVDALNLYIELSEGKISDAEELSLQGELRKAQLGASMIERIEDVAIIDSVKLHKAQFLSAYRLSAELGSVAPYYEIVGMPTPKQQMVFNSGRNDRMIYAYDVEDGVNLDLMISYRLVDGWSDVLPLSDVINSERDENYAYVLPDGVTIYFASKGHNSLGGYDIFMSRYNNSQEDYSTPVNLGMPFNSLANDYMMVIDEMAHVGWFASDRFQHSDSVVVYEFIPNGTKRLLDSNDKEYNRLVAQLKVFREPNYNEEEDDDDDEYMMESKDEELEVGINFIISDNILYTSLDQFVSEDAKKLFDKIVDADKRLESLYIILDGKRRSFLFSENEQDKQILRTEILSLENDILRYKDLVKEYTLQTRRAELKALGR